MTDQQKPIGAFTLTGPRILILVLGILALVMIIGAISGGVANTQALRESTTYSAPADASSAP